MNHDNKHEFSFYRADLSSLLVRNSSSILIADPDFVHRLMFVLRLEVADECILFDEKQHVRIAITHLMKHKSVQCEVLQIQKNKVLTPEITFLLPLLKRDSLESALYSLTESGVTSIQLIVTHKSQQKWTDKDHERALNIIHAAAEQSKQFSGVALLKPVELQKAIVQINAQQKIFFDPAGIHLSDLTNYFQSNQSFALAIGPEGDLTTEEKEILKHVDFTFTALTPTILRACQAAALSVGIIRSLMRENN